MDGGYAAPAQSFSIVHFNDVYHIGSFKVRGGGLPQSTPAASATTFMNRRGAAATEHALSPCGWLAGWPLCRRLGLGSTMEGVCALPQHQSCGPKQGAGSIHCLPQCTATRLSQPPAAALPLTPPPLLQHVTVTACILNHTLLARSSTPQQEPVGGAARFKTAISQVPGDPLVIFSGDAYNPSLASTATKGAHSMFDGGRREGREAMGRMLHSPSHTPPLLPPAPHPQWCQC